MASQWHNIGAILQQKGDHEGALEQYQRSLELKQELRDPAGVSASLHQMGTIYQMRGEYETAIEQYQRSLAIKKELGDRTGVAWSRGQIAQCLLARGQYPEAFQLLVLAHATLLELRSPNARTAASDLKALRGKWGEEPFDAAWREATGADLPEWLR